MGWQQQQQQQQRKEYRRMQMTGGSSKCRRGLAYRDAAVELAVNNRNIQHRILGHSS